MYIQGLLPDDTETGFSYTLNPLQVELYIYTLGSHISTINLGALIYLWFLYSYLSFPQVRDSRPPEVVNLRPLYFFRSLPPHFGPLISQECWFTSFKEFLPTHQFTTTVQFYWGSCVVT